MSGSDIPDLSPEATPRRLIMLVGVDGSESSLRARAYAVGLARRSHAYLIMVYVRQLSTMTAFAPGPGTAAIEEAEDEVAAELRREMTMLAEEPGPQLDAELIECTGSPFQALNQIAAERRADAIIVGASKQAGHRFVGSLAVHLVRNASCPVTVVP
ncbi:universal stress protein [Kineosporia rhizophila]|uniref:universal stress protein n=1 Tax=Kineosporia TaxID=49184 RepID=UPI001E54DB6E|nr:MULTISPECIES: universal stress protein [Kineosporia]MCE0539297.1 universal stress protein [Kineosporia rhizophila]GLY18500.1 universal stress protein A [Kineosporia sp. NBRC 101677]